MHILAVIDEEGKEKFFGPFDSGGEEALDWAVSRFDEDYFLSAMPLFKPEKYDENPTDN